MISVCLKIGIQSKHGQREILKHGVGDKVSPSDGEILVACKNMNVDWETSKIFCLNSAEPEIHGFILVETLLVALEHLFFFHTLYMIYNPWLVLWNMSSFSISWECHHPN